jgi:hypothetical protein
MDALLCQYRKQQVKRFPSDELVAYVFETTQARSPIRIFFADIYLSGGDSDILLQTPDEVHEKFTIELFNRLHQKQSLMLKVEQNYEINSSGILDLAVSLLDKHAATRRNKEIPEHVKSCDYHTHTRGTKCVSRKRKREVDEAEKVRAGPVAKCG